MKKTITLLRHTETVGNKKKILMGGRIDFPLTENGISIAKNIIKDIKNYEFDKIYCSTNKRAIDTIKIVYPNKKNIEYTDFLKEQDYGTITGKCINDLSAEHQMKYMIDPFFFPHQNGESLNQVKIRLSKFFEDIIEKSTFQNILLVTHENIIRASVAYMKNLDREVVNLKFDFCSITQYEYNNGRYQSVFFNRKSIPRVISNIS